MRSSRSSTPADPLINRSVALSRSQFDEEDEEEHTLPEITVRSILVMIVLSAILSSANAYLGLFAGMTISVSIPAAILSMAIIYPTGGNILEINAVQTGASSGSSIAAGIIYTIPAISILAADNSEEVTDASHSDGDVQYWVTSAIAIIGGLLGIMFSIPLRRALIVDSSLKFPEGVATAEVLRLTEISDDRPTQVLLIGVGALVGFIIKFLQSGFLLWAPLYEIEVVLGAFLFYFGTNLSPALMSVGYIVGLPIAIVMLMGSIINYWIVIPILFSEGRFGDTADDIWNKETRFIGVGAMLLGGFGAIIGLYPNLVAGLKSAIKAYRKIREQGFASVKRTQRDIPIPIIGITLVVILPAMFGLFMHITDNNAGISIVMSIFMMIFGFIFSAVGAYMSGVVGSSNNPISGMTLATIITSSLLLLSMFNPGKLGPNYAVLIGSVVCCAAAVAGDNLQDLKSGHIIGATPLKQQIMQLAGVLLPAVFIGPVVKLLITAYGLERSSRYPRPLLAPQAQLMASVSKSIFSKTHKLPWDMVGVGIGIAFVFLIADHLLVRFKKPIRLPVLAAALGMYLPFELAVPIVLGGVVMKLSKIILEKVHVPVPMQDMCQRNGLLFAAGLITGEAVVGILLAIPIVFVGKDAVAVFGDNTSMEWPGIITLLSTMVGLLLVVVGKHVFNRDESGHYMTL